MDPDPRSRLVREEDLYHCQQWPHDATLEYQLAVRHAGDAGRPLPSSHYWRQRYRPRFTCPTAPCFWIALGAVFGGFGLLVLHTFAPPHPPDRETPPPRRFDTPPPRYNPDPPHLLWPPRAEQPSGSFDWRATPGVSWVTGYLHSRIWYTHGYRRLDRLLELVAQTPGVMTAILSGVSGHIGTAGSLSVLAAAFVAMGPP